MRRLKRTMVGAAVVILVAILLLWTWGGRTFTFGSEIVLAAPPDRIFPYLTEPPLLKQWMGGLVESTSLSGDGVTRVGAKGREVVEENGRRFEMESEVVGLEPNRMLEVVLRHPSMESVNRYDLESEGTQTRVRMTMRLNARGSAARMMAPLIGRSVRRKLDADFARLKKLVESR